MNNRYVSYDKYGLLHLPRHLVHSRRWQDLADKLTDFDFIEAKCVSGMIYNLQADYDLALQAWSEKVSESHTRVKEMSAAFAQEIFHLDQFLKKNIDLPFADFLFQQLRNRIFCNTWGEHDWVDFWSKSPGPVLQHMRPLRPSCFVKSIKTDPESDTLRFVGAIRFTPKGDRLIAAVLCTDAACIDVESGQLLFSFRCVGRAAAMDFSTDGTQVILGGDMGPNKEGGFIQVFDLNTGSSLAVTQLKALAYKIVVDADDQVFVSCGDGSIHILNLNNLNHIRTWQPHHNLLVRALAINKSRTIIATGEYHDEDRPAIIRIWDTSSLNLLREIKGPKYGITALAFHNLDQILVSGSLHLNNGVVAWGWTLPESPGDQVLLSAQKRTQVQHLLKNGDTGDVFRFGRVISVLETSDTVGGIAFIPNKDWIVAIEGSKNQSSDSINIFTIFGGKPGNVAKVSGHPNVPVAVDVDCHGRWIATLHAKGEVFIWPVNKLQELPPSTPPPTLSDHSTDLSCRYVLSRNVDDHGFLYLTDVETGEWLQGEYQFPSLAAVIDPLATYMARIYWEQLPLNPYGENDQQSSEAWFNQFKAQTRMCCYIDAIRQGAKFPSWPIVPDLHIRKLTISANGDWGAALLQTTSHYTLLFRFSPRQGKALLARLPGELHVTDIRFSNDGNNLMLVMEEDDVAFFLIESGAEKLGPPSLVYIGLGASETLSLGPLFVGNHQFLTIHNRAEVFLLEPREPSGHDSELRIMELQGLYKHEYSIVDACCTKDGMTLVISDSYPAISVFELPKFKRLLWRPMDQACVKLFLDDRDRRLLAIGKSADIAGLHYSLMELPEYRVPKGKL